MRTKKNIINAMASTDVEHKFADIKWLFFDLGATLINEDVVWEKMCEEQISLENLGHSVSYLLDELRKGMENGTSKFSKVLEKLGYTKFARYAIEYESVYDGVTDVLDILSKKYKLGIIANQIEGLETRLQKYGICGYFDVITYSHERDVMTSKPNEKIFRIALSRANCNPESAVMIGDRYDNDIMPAKHIGMKTIRIKQGLSKNQKSDVFADTEIDNIKELLEIL